MLHVNSVYSVNSANSYSAVLPPSPMVFLVKSLYLGPLYHCHDNNLPITFHIASSKAFSKVEKFRQPLR